MNLQIIPFRVRHLSLVRPDISEKTLDRALRAEDAGIAWTACILGDPVGCAGMEVSPNGMAQVWTVFSPLIKTMPLAFFRVTKKYLEKAVAEHKPTSLIAAIDENDEAAQRFIEHLGFPRTTRIFLYERVL